MNCNFFEQLDKDPPASTIWNKFCPSEVSPEVHEGYLKKPTKSGDLKLRYFILQRDYLIYKKSPDAPHVSSAMKIKFASFATGAGVEETGEYENEK